MAGNRRVRLRATVSARAEATRHLRLPADAVLVERGRPRWIVLSCPCGCGEEIPVNLDSRSGPAWRYYMRPKYGMSLFPSVWRRSGCRSHFIIWHDQIWLFGQSDRDFARSHEPTDATLTAEAVLDELGTSSLIHFSDISERLAAVPWDVLAVCRKLAVRGLAIEGPDKQRGFFRRK